MSKKNNERVQMNLSASRETKRKFNELIDAEAQRTLEATGLILTRKQAFDKLVHYMHGALSRLEVEAYPAATCGSCLASGPGIMIAGRWSICERCLDKIMQDSEYSDSVYLQDPALHRDMTGVARGGECLHY